MDLVKSLPSRKDELTWKVLFPFLCAVMMWFSIVLALLVRAGGGRRRRVLGRRTLERYVLASPGSPVTASTTTATTTTTAAASTATRQQHNVIVPTSIRLSTVAVVRRAVVVVGGDFARSPRMQYHAISLAKSGVFDEIVLVGLDCGNQLSEALLKSGAPASQTYYSVVNPTTGQAQLDWAAVDAMASGRSSHQLGAVISTQYLATPSTAPAWFEYVFPLRSLHWVACTAYRVMALSFVFAWLLLRATCLRVNAHGQMLLTDLIVIQSPPAVPFVGIVKYVVRPLSWFYGVLFYYCGVVPAGWFNRQAMRDLREQCHIQRRTPTATRSPFLPALLVDWHNYGYTILRADRRPGVAVKAYKALELHTCAGDINLTVSEAMRQSLRSLPCLATRPVVVLYDVAPSFFGPVARQKFVSEVLRRVPAIADAHGRSTHASGQASHDTRNGGAARAPSATPSGRESWGIAPPPAWVYESGATHASTSPRGLFIVGSTSWTADDDYTILLEALQRLDLRLQHLDKYRNRSTHAGPATSASSSSSPPPAPPVSAAMAEILDVWVLITGKGVARTRFEEAVEAARLSSHITVSTLYLQSYEQYSVTLGAADVGLCLHFSSSGKDLPMKGVDMVGSGLPVAALRYPAVGELMMSDAERQQQQQQAQKKTTVTTETGASTASAAPELEECTRGWLFQTASGLERLFSHLIGLDTHCEGLRDILLLTPPGSTRSSTKASPTTAIGSSGGLHTPTFPDSNALSSLAEMQTRALQARASALTWEENWTAVALPLIESVV